MAAFAQFGSDLDKATQDKLAQGARLREVLKQPQYSPHPLEDQVAVLFLAVNSYLLDVAVEKISQFIKDYIAFLRANKTDLMRAIGETGELSIAQEGELRAAIEAYKAMRLLNG
jgi:F-type H+-transporting ATPase subunit alpha